MQAIIRVCNVGGVDNKSETQYKLCKTYATIALMCPGHMDFRDVHVCMHIKECAGKIGAGSDRDAISPTPRPCRIVKSYH